MAKIFLAIGAILGGIGAILGLGFDIKFGLYLVIGGAVVALFSLFKF